MGQKWEIDVGGEFGEPNFVQAVFEAVEGRGSDNSKRELVPAIDDSVTEEVMSGSCPIVPLLQFELVTSGCMAVISWQQTLLIYAVVSMRILVDFYHVTPGSSIAKA